jgi:chromosome segregation ATPase
MRINIKFLKPHGFALPGWIVDTPVEDAVDLVQRGIAELAPDNHEDARAAFDELFDPEAFERSFEVLEERIMRLESDNATLRAQIEQAPEAQLEGQVVTLTTEKTKLEENVKTLEARVATLEGEKKQLEGQVVTLTTEKTKLEEKLGQPVVFEVDRAELLAVNGVTDKNIDKVIAAIKVAEPPKG